MNSLRALALALLLSGSPGPLAPRPLEVEAQEAGAVVGRLLDRDSGAGVSDATVALVEAGRSALSDSSGLFHIFGLAAGVYTLRVSHLAYGEHEERILVTGDDTTAVRIRMWPTVIELEPVVVEALTREEMDFRSRGTRRNVIRRDEIARVQGGGGHLGQLLAGRIPGIRVRSDQTRIGAPICIEFRSPVSLLDVRACKHPVVILDGVRISSPEYFYSTLPLENIQRMEVIPPGEAGVQYGTDSSYGVIIIETRTAAQVLGDATPAGRSRGDVAGRSWSPYDWSVEPEPYRWKRVFGLSFLGSALGLGVGMAAADPCLSFSDLSSHFFDSACGGAATLASHLALMTLPQLGASVAARYGGGTDISRGRFLQAAVATSLVAAPGLLLSLTGEKGGFDGSEVIGHALLLVGVPMAATLADWVFRGSHQIP